MRVLRGTGEIATKLTAEREAVRRRSKTQPGCALVIGAGCSASAGIPMAQGFVDLIEARFDDDYKRAKVKDYIHCMGELDDDDRQQLIRDVCANARKLNPAHIAMAQLLAGGFVRYILTTNFDSLILQACNLLGVDPAVYDFTALASRHFSKDAMVDGPAVFYLHGQHSGVVQINTEEELAENSPKLEHLFSSINGPCFWIVAGFSGLNNPTIERLSQLDFRHRLYWVTHGESLPGGDVVKELEKPGKKAALVLGYDADRFFFSLAQGVGCETPKIFTDPRSYVDSLVERVILPDAWRSSAPSWREEETLGVLDPHPGLILNLPRFNKKGYDSPERLLASRHHPDFRARALLSNWGPLIVAVEHHSGTLRECWVVCSPQVLADFPHAEAFIQDLARGVNCHAVNLQDQNSIVNVQQRVKDIYDALAPDRGLKPKQIVADITGGNSAMTGGMVLATLEDERAIEYLRQDVRLVEPPVADGVALTRQQIREKQLLIGLRTSRAMVRDVAFSIG
jgi:hypothetical protein